MPESNATSDALQNPTELENQTEQAIVALVDEAAVSDGEAVQVPLFEGFVVESEKFTGTLSELAYALRSERLRPQDINVLRLVREYLQYYHEIVHESESKDLNLATETLPQLARVIELKLRLLLPKPPKDSEEEEEMLIKETVEAIEILEELDEAIHFLRTRRDERRILMQAQAPKPNLPRPERKIKATPSRLSELASRYNMTNYFELAKERLTLPAAIIRLLASLKEIRAGFFSEIAPKEWETQVVYFSGMLELVKQDKIIVTQDEAYSPIQIQLNEPSNKDASELN